MALALAKNSSVVPSRGANLVVRKVLEMATLAFAMMRFCHARFVADTASAEKGH